MRFLCTVALMFLFYEVSLCQIGEYKKVGPADFGDTTDGIGQHTKVYFKYLPLKTTSLEVDIGNNYFWFTIVEKKGKIHLNDHILKNGFTLAINRKMEDMDVVKATVHQLVDGKVETAKLNKKLIFKRDEGDTTYYHFRFDGYTNRDICEISYSTKTEFTKNLLVIRMNEISTSSRARADIIIPELIVFTLQLIGIDDSLTQDETIYENTKGLYGKDVTYQSKKSTYYTNPALNRYHPRIVATANYGRKP